MKRKLTFSLGAAWVVFVAAVAVYHLTTASTPWPVTDGSGPGGSSENLYVLRIDPRTDPERIAGDLEALGAELGDPLGDSQWLVRAPASAADRLDRAYAGKLAPYTSESRVQAGLGNNDGATVSVLITTFSPEDKTELARAVEKAGGQVTRGLGESGTTLRAEIPPGVEQRIAALPQVVYVEEYKEPAFLNDHARDVAGVSPVAVSRFILPRGLTGAGQIVAIADSGLGTGSYADLPPDLANISEHMPKVLYLDSVAGGNTSDPTGHGTHIAGTVAGTGAASGGKYRGMAPGAGIYFQALLNANGEPDPPADLVALYEPAYDGGARIHVNGWGRETNGYLSPASQIDRFVRRHPDFTVVVGAGNSGPGKGTLTSEANAKNALVIGASQNPRPVFGDDSSDPGAMASFSSSGPTGDGRQKPDLVAPGTAIVSAKSGLIEGDFAPNSAYTTMQGTSMAAAVGGGAVALLREYFVKHQEIKSPSAALIKAALVNGASLLPGVERRLQGFGRLDVAATVAALEAGRFTAVDGTKGVAAGSSTTYRLRVTDPDVPLKVSLAWTDPQAAPGAKKALVNDLDLVVRGPSGTFHGNDFAGKGQKDSLNNVEQVIVEHPKSGEYEIIVRGAAIVKNVVPGDGKAAQDYALVYGQALAKDTVVAVGEEGIKLAGGSEIDPAASDVTVAVDDRKAGVGSIRPGADVYIYKPSSGKSKSFVFGRNWDAGGVRLLTIGGKPTVARVSFSNREGGYVLAEQAVARLNGEPLDDVKRLPVGVAVQASINPSTQLLWTLDAEYVEIEGILAAVDRVAWTVRLLNDNRVYRLRSDVATYFSNTMVEGDRDNLPFGASLATSVEELVPGMPVKLGLLPNGEITCITAQREVVAAFLLSGNPSGGLRLATGTVYLPVPGTPVERDGKPADLGSLREGDLVMAAVIPGTRSCISISAYSSVLYGRVVFATDDILYLSTFDGGTLRLDVDEETEVYRWGLLAGLDQLHPGQWARVITAPGSRAAFRVDVADEVSESKGRLASFDKATSLLAMAGGHSYACGQRTSYTKDGFPITSGDLRAGEEVTVYSVPVAGSEPVAIAVQASSLSSAEAPSLKILSLMPTRDGHLVRGQTTADRLYLWLPGKKGVSVQTISTGEFYSYLPFSDGSGSVRYVAFDDDTGGIAEKTLDLKPRTTAVALSDIAGHWAESDIREMAGRGLIAGYGDGTYKPNKAVTRLEMALLMARVAGLVPAKGTNPDYTDRAQIPRWARDSVAIAQQRGLIEGYGDGSFQPARLITRAEGVAMVARLCSLIGVALTEPDQDPPYQDWNRVPEWARNDLAAVYALGLLGSEGTLRPAANLTRAEAAVILNRLVKVQEWAQSAPH